MTYAMAVSVAQICSLVCAAMNPVFKVLELNLYLSLAVLEHLEIMQQYLLLGLAKHQN